MMNKQAILQADDKQLNLWCAKYVMEWEEYHHDEAKRGKRYQSDLVFVTNLFGLVEYNENPNSFLDFKNWEYSIDHDFWMDRWGEFFPATEIRQALPLLDRVATEWRIEGNTKGKWSVSIKSNRGDPATERIKWYHGEANSLAKAIVLACLSAVDERENQP